MGKEPDYLTMEKLAVYFLGIGISIVSVSLLFVPFNLLGYTGFVLIVDFAMAIPLVGFATELML